MLHQHLALSSPLNPRDVLDRLDAFAKDWRESKLPPEVRSAGVHSCRLVVTRPGFRLSLEPQGGGPQLVWVGLVAAADASGRIDVRSELSKGSRAWIAVLLAFLSFSALSDASAGARWFSIIGLILTGGAATFATAWRSTEQSALCVAVLAHIAAARVSSPPRAV